MTVPPSLAQRNMWLDLLFNLIDLLAACWQDRRDAHHQVHFTNDEERDDQTLHEGREEVHRRGDTPRWPHKDHPLRVRWDE